MSTGPWKMDRAAALRRADRAEWRRQVRHLQRAIAYREEECIRMQAQLDKLLETGPPSLTEKKS